MSVSNPVIDYIDGETRRIYLRSGVRSFDPVDDIYKEVRNLRRLDETLRQFDMFVESGGNIPRPGRPPTDRYLILRQGTKIVPEDVSHNLTINGEMFTDDENDAEVIDFTPLSNGVSVFVSDSITKSVLTIQQAETLLNIGLISELLIKHENADEVKQADGTVTKYEEGTNTVLGNPKQFTQNCETKEASLIKK